MDTFKQHTVTLYEDVRSNAELSTFFRQFRKFCDEVVMQPETLNIPEKRQQARELIYCATDLLQQEQWASRFSQIIEDVRIMIDNVRQDAVTTSFTSKLEKFARDLVFLTQMVSQIYG